MRLVKSVNTRVRLNRIRRKSSICCD